jgi:hypothetical protein
LTPRGRGGHADALEARANACSGSGRAEPCATGDFDRKLRGGPV